MNTQSCFCNTSEDEYTEYGISIAYEEFIRDSEAFKELVKMKKQGYNLNIVGRNIVPVDSEGLEAAYDYYEFDHEMYLFAMLVLKDLPWRK